LLAHLIVVFNLLLQAIINKEIYHKWSIMKLPLKLVLMLLKKNRFMK